MRKHILISSFALSMIFWISTSFNKSTPAVRMSKAATYTLTIKIPNVRNNKGRIQLQIYLDQKTFAAESPWKSTYISKKKLSGNTIIHRISGFKPGVYGLALLDDENSNTEMDYGLMLPKEGFGFSDYYHTSWSKPTFSDFKFTLSGDKTVVMKIRYM